MSTTTTTSTTGASLYEGIPPLASQAEDFITRTFYGKSAGAARARAYAMGLQSPLWLWTHQQITRDAGGAPKEMRRVVHLLHWMQRSGADVTQVAVLLPLAAKAIFKHELEQLSAEGTGIISPVVLAHHELAALNRRDNTRYTYRAVIYLVDALPRNLNTSAQPLPVSEEMFISEAMGAATDAFVLCADAGWMAPQLQAKWYKMFVTKLMDVQPFVSFDGTATTEAVMQAANARFPSLVGPAIPLCCSRHPNQRQLEHANARVEPCCKHLCLSPYACQQPDHVCTRTCHPGEGHTGCLYACGKTLSCGHKCLLKCGQPCNCFEVVEHPLTCSHERLIGMNKDTLEPIYVTVQHVFKGVCGDAQLPCAVEYETVCARCLGSLTVKCFEAQEQEHTLEHKTIVCPACRRRERELRAKLLGELLTDVEAQKKKVKAELQRTLHHQRKAAAQGLFRPGTRVVIVDATKCVPPLFAEDDFPGIEFVDMSDPSFFTEMDGAYGTFLSNHVDVMDRSELRNLVRLPSGKHVLVTDGGLRMIQALTTGITGTAPLMLTFQGGQGGDSTEAARVDDAEYAMARTMVNGTYYLAQPIPCEACGEGAVLTDKVVRVVSVDPASPKNVVIECAVTTVAEHDSGGSSEGEGTGAPAADDANVEQATKRRRVEGTGGESVKYACTSQLFRVSAPIAALEAMPAMAEGKYVFVTAPERQVRNPHDLAKIEAQLRHSAEVQLLADAHVTAAPIDADVPYALVRIINVPLGCEAVRGPCAVLRCDGARVVVRAKSSKALGGQRRGGGGGGGRGLTHPVVPAVGATPRYVIVPFMFTVGDELAEAEGALDTAAQQVFEQRLRAELTTLSDELALRNEEEDFHAQQQMPPVTSAMLAGEQRAYSVPVPLPTAGAIATARKSAMELPVGTPIATRLAHAKDKLVSKQETALLPQWVTTMTEKAARDRESDAHHVKYIRSLKN